MADSRIDSRSGALGKGFMLAVDCILRYQALTATVIIAIHLYVDWYLGLHLIGPLMALGLLVLCYLFRSPLHPWVQPRALWLWGLFLVITIYPAIRGGLLLRYDAASFYPSDIFGALVMFWLGLLIARDDASIRLFLKVFSGFGALLAIHTIIQATTGVVLFGSAKWTTFLIDQATNYQVAGSHILRAGSFFIDPNWNGAFFAMMFFLPFGLFVESSSRLEKGLYLAEMCLMLPALLFTYSNGAWVAIIGGLIVFILLLGRVRYQIMLSLSILIVGIAMAALFPMQIALQLKHATGNNELSLRLATWETALRVIRAYPFTGVGLGHEAYLTRANAYRVPAQIVPFSHPHDSYLEWAAMGGLPVLIVFLALLLFAFWLAWRNWLQADVRVRPLLGGGIAAMAALSINSISVNGWTHFALAMIGWLIFGIIASPLLAKNRNRENQPVEIIPEASRA